MQSSNALLNEVYVPRATVPFEPVKLDAPSTKSNIKINYPVFKPTQRPSVSVRAAAEENLQKELSDLNKNKHNLDELIQKAYNLQSQAQAKKTEFKLTPSYEAPRQLWWPEERKTEIKVTPKKVPIVTPIVRPVIKKTAPPPPPIKLATHPAVKTISPTPTPMAQTPISQPGPDFLDYFLPTVSELVDPFHDPNRRRVVYVIKAFGYLFFGVGIFETSRYAGQSFSLSGIFEVLSIFFVAGIFLFFGANLNLLAKPINPYQIKEVV